MPLERQQTQKNCRLVLGWFDVKSTSKGWWSTSNQLPNNGQLGGSVMVNTTRKYYRNTSVSQLRGMDTCGEKCGSEPTTEEQQNHPVQLQDSAHLRSSLSGLPGRRDAPRRTTSPKSQRRVILCVSARPRPVVPLPDSTTAAAPWRCRRRQDPSEWTTRLRWSDRGLQRPYASPGWWLWLTMSGEWVGWWWLRLVDVGWWVGWIKKAG